MKIDFSKSVSMVQTFVKNHKTELLAAGGICGAIGGVISSAIGTAKAIKKIEKAKQEKGDDLTALETAKEVVPCYIPAATLLTMSVSCQALGVKNTMKLGATLASSKMMLDRVTQEYEDYKEESAKKMTEKEVLDVKNRVADRAIERSSFKDYDRAVDTTSPYVYLPWIDLVSGQEFMAPMNEIESAINELNRQMLNEQYVSVNEYLDILGLDHIMIGDELGWHIDRGMVQIPRNPQTRPNSKGIPCYILAPTKPYSDYMYL